MSNSIYNTLGNICLCLNRFARNKQGNLAVIAAFLMLPVTISVGAAVDYSRVYHRQTQLSSALDAAILAAAKKLSSGTLNDNQVEVYVNAMVSANLSKAITNGLNYQISNINNNKVDGTLSGDIASNLPMAFMSLASLNTVSVSSSSEVSYSNHQVELTMMLDVTGSMYGSKITALKAAAKDAVKILLPTGIVNNKKTRIGLVPYSYSVNAGKYADNVTSNLSYKCVTERGGSEAFSDASPTTFPVGADPRAIDQDYCPSKAIRPLTSNRTKLIKDIKAYSAGGYTAGHLGIAWSYYMLSPKWNSIWPSKSDANPYNNEKTLKIALLMTDGEFNTYYDGTAGTAWGDNSALSNNAAIQTCLNMKANGIVVYAVAFEAPASAQAILQSCATPDTNDVQHYYNAANGSQLKYAFTNIAKSIITLRISK